MSMPSGPTSTAPSAPRLTSTYSTPSARTSSAASTTAATEPSSRPTSSASSVPVRLDDARLRREGGLQGVAAGVDDQVSAGRLGLLEQGGDLLAGEVGRRAPRDDEPVAVAHARAHRRRDRREIGVGERRAGFVELRHGAVGLADRGVRPGTSADRHEAAQDAVALEQAAQLGALRACDRDDGE